ncbi:hypothetical protein CUMW_167060, partial [Citrus unshiu]
FFFIHITKNTKTKESPSSTASNIIPKSYPLVGSFFAALANRHRFIPWMTPIPQNTPSATFVLKRLNSVQFVTANPDNFPAHAQKTQFHNYPKGIDFQPIRFDLLGDGIFNSDGDKWKFQRQVSSHEFNTKSLRKFVETVVETELSDRLIHILSAAAADKTVLDLQDMLQRFAFVNICKTAFGYDPEYLSPSLPQAEFARSFDDAVQTSAERFREPLRIFWKIQRLLNIGSQKRLQVAICQVREFAENIIIEKKKELKSNISPDESMHLLDIVISFTLAGRDTTSAPLTWIFWLLFRNPEAETPILNEIREKSDAPVFEDIKDMVFTHASLCESMRFYPPVPLDGKLAKKDDVWPDGKVIKKETRNDWAEYKPRRWLKEDGDHDKWTFVGRDPYTYPVFHAGARICLGKEMASLQMKRVVAAVLRRFKDESTFQ